MAIRVAFEGGDDHVRSTLSGAHRDRHAAGRERTKETKAAAAQLREIGKIKQADQLEEGQTRRIHAAIQRARRQDERLANRPRRRIRAEVSKLPKVSGKLRRARYAHEDYGTGGLSEPSRSGAKDLYVQFIPRGLRSGSIRNYKDGTAKPPGNRSPWKSGETGDKIQYICREEALEDVAGCIISNMGADLRERVACGLAIERVEELGRADAGVYRHVIVALPHELSPDQRVELLNWLVKPMGDLKLPFTASLHKPDKDGDQRNYHMHLVFSLRPFERVGPTEWEFTPSKLTWIETPAGLLLIRRLLAREFNRALKKAGVESRWTPLSRAARNEPSPGNTKRHRSDIRGDRDLAAAEMDERAANRRLRLVAAVQSCVDALRSEAARLTGAAVSRSAFLGRVITFIEGAHVDRAEESRRQARLRTVAFEKNIAAEVAAEALRARAFDRRSSSQGESAVRSPSLAPLIDHFRDDTLVKTALAFDRGATAVTADLQTPDAIASRPRNDTSAGPDVMLSTVPRDSAIELSRPVVGSGQAVDVVNAATGAAMQVPLENASAKPEPAPSNVAVDLGGSTGGTLAQSETPPNLIVKAITVTSSSQREPDDGDEISPGWSGLDHASEDTKAAKAGSLPATITSKGDDYDRRTGTQRRWDTRARYTSPRQRRSTGYAGSFAAAPELVVPEMSRGRFHDNRGCRHAEREKRVLLSLFWERHVAPGAEDGDSLRRLGIVASLIEPGTGIVESLVPIVDGLDGLGLPTSSLFDVEPEPAGLGGVTTARGTPEREQAAEINPLPAVETNIENDQPDARAGFVEAVPSNPADSSLVADEPVAPDTAFALPISLAAQSKPIEGGHADETDLGAGEVPAEAQAGTRKALVPREPLEAVASITPDDLEAVLNVFQEHGSKCMRRVEGKMELDKSLFEHFPRPALQAAWKSPRVRKAFSDVTKAAEAEEDDLLQGGSSNRGHDR